MAGIGSPDRQPERPKMGGSCHPTAKGSRTAKTGGFATVRFRRYRNLSRHSEVIVEREVYFEKVAWSYMPCHWKGFAVMGAIILPTIGAIILAQTLLNNFG
jgi:hypothetical protein